VQTGVRTEQQADGTITRQLTVETAHSGYAFKWPDLRYVFDIMIVLGSARAGAEHDVLPRATEE